MTDPRLDKVVPIFMDMFTKLLNAKGMMRYRAGMVEEVEKAMQEEKEEAEVVEASIDPANTNTATLILETRGSLQTLNTFQLRSLASKKGLQPDKNVKKPELIEMILSHT